MKDFMLYACSFKYQRIFNIYSKVHYILFPGPIFTVHYPLFVKPYDRKPEQNLELGTFPTIQWNGLK